MIYLMADGRSSLRPGRFWDPLTGTPLDRIEIRKLFEGEKWANQNVFRTIAQIGTLVRESESRTSRIRREFGFLASYCFAYLFMVQSGLNLQQIVEFECPDSVAALMTTAEVSSQGKRLIKWRAGGMPVYAEFPIGFFPKIEKYLELRRLLTESKDVGTLLIGQSRDGLAAAIAESFLIQMTNWLESLGISFPNIKSRKSRTSMQDFLIRTESVEVAARVMNHSPETTKRKYSNGSSELQVQEMGEFFKRFETALIDGPRSEAEVESAVGSCFSYRNPTPIHTEVPVMPNCASLEGCLFCVNHKVHADETDLRKLLSCRRCLVLTGEANAIDVRSDPVFSVVSNRLDTLIGELREAMDVEVFARIQEEVERYGILDQFWDEKLNQLMDLGII